MQTCHNDIRNEIFQFSICLLPLHNAFIGRSKIMSMQTKAKFYQVGYLKLLRSLHANENEIIKKFEIEIQKQPFLGRQRAQTT